MSAFMNSISVRPFEDTPMELCSPKENSDKVLITRRQIGIALGYSCPETSIAHIHNTHKEIIDPYAMSVGIGQRGRGHVVAYTLKGAMEIARFSKKERANEFMNWVWDVITDFLAKAAQDGCQAQQNETPVQLEMQPQSLTEKAEIPEMQELHSAIAELKDIGTELKKLSEKMAEASVPNVHTNTVVPKEAKPLPKFIPAMAEIIAEDESSGRKVVPLKEKIENSPWASMARKLVRSLAEERGDMSIGSGRTLFLIYRCIGDDKMKELIREYQDAYGVLPKVRINVFYTKAGYQLLEKAVASVKKEYVLDKIKDAFIKSGKTLDEAMAALA